MSHEPVLLLLFFWLPSVVFGTVAASVAAERHGRGLAEGVLLGLLLGIPGALVELLLPYHGRPTAPTAGAARTPAPSTSATHAG